jgi:uncharacterized repeat protein (TIGR03803 family)
MTRLIRSWLWLVAAQMAWAAPATAQTPRFATLHTFGGPTTATSPRVVTQTPQGDFLVTADGAGYSTISRVSRQGDITVLHVFGDFGTTRLVGGADGYYYGRSISDGPYGKGTIFRIAPDGRFETLYTFTGADGQDPRGDLVASADGNIYGVSTYGGALWFFVIAPDGTVRLNNFTVPDATAIFTVGSDGGIYGVLGNPTFFLLPQPTTRIYKRAPDGTITILYDFQVYERIERLVPGANGTLLGLASAPLNSYPYSLCTVFRVGQSGGFTPLVSLATGCFGRPVDAPDGLTYVALDADVYRINASGGYALVHHFLGDEGSSVSDMILGSDGALWGTTYNGGFFDGGTLYRMTLGGDRRTIASFWAGSSEGTSVRGPLVAGPDGNFYGVTTNGGPFGMGTVFRVSRFGALTTLYAFAARGDGAVPQGLVLGADGAFYGTTTGFQTYQGRTEPGTFFRISPSGALTTLFVFRRFEDGYNPSPLTLGADGFLYGFTATGGPAGVGTAFRMSTRGEMTILHTFTSSERDAASGSVDEAAVQGSDGALYAITVLHSGFYGPLRTAVIRVALDGGLAIMASTRDLAIRSNLVLGRDGVIYGIGATGSTARLYTISRSGSFALGPAIDGDSAEYFYDPRLAFQGADGNLYGTTSIYGNPVVVRIARTGDVTVVHAVAEGSGVATIVDGGDGLIYGTSRGNGPTYADRLFSLSSSPRPTVGDINGDRFGDLVFTNPTDGRVQLWFMANTIVGEIATVGPVTDPNLHLVAYADLNGDGYLDLVWRHGGSGGNQVWFMKGATILSSANLPTVRDRAWQLVGAADFDRDGKADLVWRHADTGQNVVWFMNGNVLVRTAMLPTLADTNWRLVGFRDLNQDDAPDLFWRHAVTGDNAVWFMSGTTVIGTQVLAPIADAAWEIAAIVDINDDDQPDLIWRNRITGANAAWLLRGTEVIATPVLSSADPVWRPAQAFLRPAVRDFDGDGRSDLAWRDPGSALQRAWMMSGTSKLGEMPLPSLPGSAQWTVAATGDMDGNGTPDLVWRNNVTGQNAVWFVIGGRLVLTRWIPTVADLNWRLVAAADLNGDGLVDLIWRHAVTGQNVVWFTGTFTVDGSMYFASAPLPDVVDPAWQIADAADMNGDRFADLIWRNSITGENLIWYMSRATRIGMAALQTVADPNWQIASAIDLNADGGVDLVWRNTATNVNAVWYMSDAAIIGVDYLPPAGRPDWVPIR